MPASSFNAWVFLALAIAANITANVALKLAVSPKASQGSGIAGLLMQPTFWLGILAAGALLASYLAAVRTLPVSTAYVAISAFAMIGLILVDWLFFHVQLDTARIVGVLLVITGVWLVSYQR